MFAASSTLSFALWLSCLVAIYLSCSLFDERQVEKFVMLTPPGLKESFSKCLSWIIDGDVAYYLYS